MRRLTAGWPSLLLAAMLLLARVVVPAAAMPAMSDGLPFQATICHTAAPGDPPAHGHDHQACLVCPACHVAAHAVLPTPAPSVRPAVTVWAVDAGAPLPPATGPPGQIRTAAQPTGPPRLSA